MAGRRGGGKILLGWVVWWFFFFSFLKKFDPFLSSFPSRFPSGVGFACRRRRRRQRRESALSVVTARLGLVLGNGDFPLGVPKAEEKGGEGAARRRLSQVPGLPGEKREPGVSALRPQPLCPLGVSPPPGSPGRPARCWRPHSCAEFVSAPRRRPPCAPRWPSPPHLHGEGDAPQRSVPLGDEQGGGKAGDPAGWPPATLPLSSPPPAPSSSSSPITSCLVSVGNETAGAAASLNPSPPRHP